MATLLCVAMHEEMK